MIDSRMMTTGQPPLCRHTYERLIACSCLFGLDRTCSYLRLVAVALNRSLRFRFPNREMSRSTFWQRLSGPQLRRITAASLLPLVYCFSYNLARHHNWADSVFLLNSETPSAHTHFPPGRSGARPRPGAIKLSDPMRLADRKAQEDGATDIFGVTEA
jgi:hypothetical protein